jgi:hypothetical protein
MMDRRLLRDQWARRPGRRRVAIMRSPPWFQRDPAELLIIYFPHITRLVNLPMGQPWAFAQLRQVGFDLLAAQISSFSPRVVSDKIPEPIQIVDDG